MQRIVIIDESPVVCKVAKKILSDLDFLVVDTDSISQAKSFCEADLPAVLVIDAELDGALDLIETVRAMEGGQDIQVVYTLVEADLKRMMNGRRSGVNEFLLKPFDRTSLTRLFGPMRTAA